jgi:hypothetical protein
VRRGGAVPMRDGAAGVGRSTESGPGPTLGARGAATAAGPSPPRGTAEPRCPPPPGGCAHRRGERQRERGGVLDRGGGQG